jgi:hypothetical protein
MCPQIKPSSFQLLKLFKIHFEHMLFEFFTDLTFKETRIRNRDVSSTDWVNYNQLFKLNPFPLVPAFFIIAGKNKGQN